MNSVLIVSSSEKSIALFEELLTACSYSEIAVAKRGNEARRILIEKGFDLCIINAPLVDEFGIELALNIAQKSIMQILMIVKNELADEISAKVEDYGVFVVAKPVNRQVFWNALKLMAAAHKRMMSLRKENVQLQKKIEDIRYIDRAKCMLIEYFKMSEAEAHRFIEKQAMDMRITKREVAASILKNYER